MRVANSRDPAAIGDAPHQARQRFGNLALGRRADICLAQSVSTPSCPVRQAGRHSRSVPLARLCASLLAVAAQDVEDRLSRSASLTPIARSPLGVVASAAALPSGAGTQFDRPCGPAGSIALAVRPLKAPDGSRQKNDPFKEFEDAREVSAIVGVRAAADLWP